MGKLQMINLFLAIYYLITVSLCDSSGNNKAMQEEIEEVPTRKNLATDTDGTKAPREETSQPSKSSTPVEVDYD
jgi:hypothetical protein